MTSRVTPSSLTCRTVTMQTVNIDLRLLNHDCICRGSKRFDHAGGGQAPRLLCDSYAYAHYTIRYEIIHRVCQKTAHPSFSLDGTNNNNCTWCFKIIISSSMSSSRFPVIMWNITRPLLNNFKQLGLLKLTDICCLRTALFLFKFLHHWLPATFNNYFTKVSSLDHYSILTL